MKYLSITTVLIATLLLPSAYALKFETTQSGRSLIIRDCDYSKPEDEGDALCKAQKATCSSGGFCGKSDGYEGDGHRIEALLSAQKFDSVYLYSNGGDVTAGIQVGLALRKAGAMVIVPSNARCISSCTIAFMGGALRSVRDPLSFRVHSSSAYLDVDNILASMQARSLSELNESHWMNLGSLTYMRSLYSIATLLVYFNDMSDIRNDGRETQQSIDRISAFAIGKPVDLGRTAVELWFRKKWREPALQQGGWASSWLKRRGQDPMALSGAQLSKIAAQDQSTANLNFRVQLEGSALLQNLAMSAERDAVRAVLTSLRADESIGGGLQLRAGLDKLDAMYSTIISDTFKPTEEILLLRGYITHREGGQ